jgi:hypothetical protein
MKNFYTFSSQNNAVGLHSQNGLARCLQLQNLELGEYEPVVKQSLQIIIAILILRIWGVVSRRHCTVTTYKHWLLKIIFLPWSSQMKLAVLYCQSCTYSTSNREVQSIAWLWIHASRLYWILLSPTSHLCMFTSNVGLNSWKLSADGFDPDY